MVLWFNSTALHPTVLRTTRCQVVIPVLPRKETSLTLKQERYVLEVLIDGDRRRAVREAGYEVTSDDAADQCASRLMANVKVKAFYHDKKAEYNAEKKRQAQDWYNYLWYIAIEAIDERDWTGAVAAMREIGRHLGVYDIDNNQKRNITPADALAIKERLVSLGADFSRRNAPPHLQHPQQQASLLQGPKAGDS
jgi:hypothetical protein